MKTRNVTFHPKQLEAFNFQTQYGAAIAGVQSGKTFLGAYWAAKMIAERKGDGLIAAPTYKILQQSTIPKFFKEFGYYKKFYKEQKGVIDLPDGRNIYVRSMDNPLGVEGMTIDWAWLDEAGQMPLMAWTVVRSRTSTTKGKVLITTTPYNMGWLYQDFFLPATKGEDKDLTVVSWASVDSPYFPKDFYEKEQQRLRAEEFSRRYMGAFTRMEGLVYDLRPWHKIEPKYTKAEITLGGVDWGYSNPAAIIVIKYCDGAYYLVDEWYETKKTTPEIIEEMQNMQNKWGINRWYADSANPEKVQEAQTGTGLYVVPYVKKKDSINQGVSHIQQLMKENRFFVFNNLHNTLHEFETYHYHEADDDGSYKKDEPVAKDNHLMDAMRYAIHGYAPATRFFVQKTSGVKSFIQEMLGKKQKTSSKDINSYV